jgi:hypothetical protein
MVIRDRTSQWIPLAVPICEIIQIKKGPVKSQKDDDFVNAAFWHESG